jgi:hypothetical protein
VNLHIGSLECHSESSCALFSTLVLRCNETGSLFWIVSLTFYVVYCKGYVMIPLKYGCLLDSILSSIFRYMNVCYEVCSMSTNGIPVNAMTPLSISKLCD